MPTRRKEQKLVPLDRRCSTPFTTPAQKMGRVLQKSIVKSTVNWNGCVFWPRERRKKGEKGGRTDGGVWSEVLENHLLSLRIRGARRRVQNTVIFNVLTNANEMDHD